MAQDIWSYRDDVYGTQSGSVATRSSTDIAGFHVEARDGSIGKVDDATYEVGAGYIVVDTGPWIFGKKVMLPAGTISRIDVDDEKVFVNRTKDQIKASPEYDDADLAYDEGYRSNLAGYYGRGGPGWYDDGL